MTVDQAMVGVRVGCRVRFPGVDAGDKGTVIETEPRGYFTVRWDRKPGDRLLRALEDLFYGHDAYMLEAL